MTDREKPLYYRDYLQLDRVLGSQALESTRLGATAHDEMLFIIVHQAYELWFKQILWELDAVRSIFDRDTILEKDIGRAVSHLERIVEIQRVIVQQIDILETMTPLDFLDFRDILIPASGFQSLQFRLIEIKLGLQRADRVQHGGRDYLQRLSTADRREAEAAERDRTLLKLVERWLERTPFLTFGEFDFWKAYARSVERMFGRDRAAIASNPTLTELQRERQLEGLEQTANQFRALLTPLSYEELRAEGAVRLSRKAFTAALLINLYRDEPILHLPFRLLTLLMDIDENFATWRYRHALMVVRMIGSKIGTGGSSGHDYLRKVADENKVFSDLFTVSTFLIPRSELPELPEDVVQTMGFRYDAPVS